MKRGAFFLVIVSLFSLPLFAQATSSEFGLLFGGSKRINDVPGNQGSDGVKDFKFSNSVKEAYYAVDLDQMSRFRIKVGEVTLPYPDTQNSGKTIKGEIQHIDALVDYRFGEAFGTSALFAGVGMYRQDAQGYSDETNVGLSGGVSADFPLSPRYGIIVEAAYHWVRIPERPRFVTLTGGLRIGF
jgi:hypothetical protein